MRIGSIIVKTLGGDFINVHSSNRPQEAKEIFNALKAEARMYRAKGEKEKCTIGGELVDILCIWLFTESEGRYTSQLGYETEAELKVKAQETALKEKAVKKAIAEKQEGELSRIQKAKQEEENKAKAQEDAKKKLIAEQLEAESVALKASKAPTQKPAKKVSKGK